MLYVLIFTIMVIALKITKIKNNIRNYKTGYKVYKKDSKTFIYAEKINHKWKEIEIERTYELGSFFQILKMKKIGNHIQIGPKIEQ